MRKILFINSNNFQFQDIVWGFLELEYDISIYPDCFHSYGHDEKKMDTLSTALESEDYWFVFSYNFCPDISVVCQKKQLPYVSWTIDSLELPLHTRHCLSPYNFIHIFDYEEYELVKERFCPPHLYYLPLAANTTRLGNISITDGDIKRFSSDVSFVGNLYDTDELQKLEQNHILPDAILKFFDAVLEYYTGRWNGESIYDCLDQQTCDIIKANLPKGYLNSYDIPDSYYYAFSLFGRRLANHDRLLLLKHLSNHVPFHFWGKQIDVPFPLIQKGIVDYNSEFAKVACLSKININLTIPRIATGINLRCFDIMGSGGFLMTNYRQCMDMHFYANEDYVCFTDPDDLIRKTEYYLKHYRERMQIAANGYRKVIKEHTCVHRANEIISHLTDAGYGL